MEAIDYMCLQSAQPRTAVIGINVKNAVYTRVDGDGTSETAKITKR